MDVKSIKEIIKVIDSSNLTYFEYEENGIKVTMKKEAYIAASNSNVIKENEVIQNKVIKQHILQEEKISEVNEVMVSKSEKEIVEIKSPMVGTFYGAPSPNEKSFVEVGSKVKKGDVLCIIEAMKLMNEIEAEVDGTVEEILVNNESMIEYGETLFKIVPY